MNRKELINWFSQYERERKLPVSSTDSWPVLKSDLFFYWYTNTKNENNSESKIFNKRPSLVRKIFNIGKYFLRFIKEGRKKNVLFAGFAAHRTELNGKFVNKFFCDLTREREQNLELEYGSKNTSARYENDNNIIFTEDLEPIVKSLSFVVKRRKYLDNDLKNIIKRYNKEVKQLPEGYINTFENKMHLIYVYSLIFSFILGLTSIKRTYILCYYNVQMFGLLIAANKRKIVTYDVQHGSQGPLHPMYNFDCFKNIENYPISLPKKFWCWDDASFRSLQGWLPPGKGEDVEVRGNPWIDFSLKYSRDESYHLFDDSQRMILITLQEPVITDRWLNVIKNLDNKKFIWWLRFHPRMMEKKDFWKEYFLDENINNVEIDRASIIPLPILLDKSFLHVSRYSGSIIEGCILGTKTLITDQIGIETYGHYIDNVRVYDVVDLTSDQLIKLIENLEIA